MFLYAKGVIKKVMCVCNIIQNSDNRSKEYTFHVYLTFHTAD